MMDNSVVYFNWNPVVVIDYDILCSFDENVCILVVGSWCIASLHYVCVRMCGIFCACVYIYISGLYFGIKL
jgi:hypothetical protein